MTNNGIRQLPLWGTVVEAYVVTLRSFRYVIRISWAWVAVMRPIVFGYNLAAFHLGWATDGDPRSAGWTMDVVFSTLLLSPMLASIAVAWHRKLLIGET